VEIKCIYMEPKDRPIEKAEFQVDGGAVVTVDICNEHVRPVRLKWQSSVQTASFSKSDFDDFAALVNRINKQIGNV